MFDRHCVLLVFVMLVQLGWMSKFKAIMLANAEGLENHMSTCHMYMTDMWVVCLCFLCIAFQYLHNSCHHRTVHST